MRTIMITVATIVLLTVSARAQQQNTAPWMSLPTKDQPSDHTPDEHSNAPKVNEKAYRSALDGIPETKGHDPWRSVRETPKTKSPR